MKTWSQELSYLPDFFSSTELRHQWSLHWIMVRFAHRFMKFLSEQPLICHVALERNVLSMCCIFFLKFHFALLFCFVFRSDLVVLRGYSWLCSEVIAESTWNSNQSWQDVRP